jgi:predicted chitinase
MDLNLGYTQELIKAGEAKGLLRNQLAYLLATAYHETAHTMKPVAEGYWIKNAEAWRKKNLRYYPWYGRGFVQLTWEANYKKASQELGVDLINNKDLAMDPTVAAKIAVLGMVEGWFTGKKLSDYCTLGKSDFLNARRIINGMDAAAKIAGYAEQYDADLKKNGYGEE